MTQEEAAPMEYRTVTVTARVYSGSDDHARHTVYWALDKADQPLLVEELEVIR